MSRSARTILGVAVLSAVFSCAPAGATTVGGDTQSSNGPFVLARGRLFLPTFVSDNPGESGGEPTDTSSVLSFRPPSHNWTQLDLTDNGYGEPALGSSGKTVAIAWETPNLQSGLLTSRHVVARITHATDGSPGSPDVAVRPDSSRAVVWPDSNGVHLQVVSATGVPAPGVLLAPDVADTVTAVPVGGGTWWVLWRNSSRLRARQVAADGSMGPLRDLAAASATNGPHPPFLDPSSDHAWKAASDGHGGLWVGLPRGLLHVTTTGVSTTASSSRPVVVGTAGRRAAVGLRSGRGDITVRLITGDTERTVHLAGLGTPIDAAVDPVSHKTYLLSIGAKEIVRLTAIGRGGKHRSTALAICHRRGTGQVDASNGLVAVACAGRYVERDNVETGGDYQYGRNDVYLLVRGGKVLRHQTFFEGDYSY
jgi:hypothetical protein